MVTQQFSWRAFSWPTFDAAMGDPFEDWETAADDLVRSFFVFSRFC